MKTRCLYLFVIILMIFLPACDFLDTDKKPAEPYPGPSFEDYERYDNPQKFKDEEEKEDKKPAEPYPGPSAKDYDWYDFSSNKQKESPSTSENDQNQTENQKSEGSGAYPIKYQATGIKTTFSSNGDVSCKIDTPLLLIIKADQSAVLSSTAAHIVDHYNCVRDELVVTYTVDGIANETDQVVLFDSCNDNGYTASGRIEYKEGILSGEVVCITKKGKTEVILTVGK